MNEQDLLELLRAAATHAQLLDHLTGMFPVDEAAELLRAMADNLDVRRGLGRVTDGPSDFGIWSTP